MRINLMNARRPVVQYRARTFGGDIFTRTFEIARHPEPGAPHDLSEVRARAGRTFDADPWLVCLEVITGRRQRDVYVREARRVM